MPLASVCAVRVTPVSVWVTVTSAPGIADPVASLTVPEIWDTDCARRAKHSPRHKKTGTNDLVAIRFINFLPPNSYSNLSECNQANLLATYIYLDVWNYIFEEPNCQEE